MIIKPFRDATLKGGGWATDLRNRLKNGRLVGVPTGGKYCGGCMRCGRPMKGSKTGYQSKKNLLPRDKKGRFLKRK